MTKFHPRTCGSSLGLFDRQGSIRRKFDFNLSKDVAVKAAANEAKVMTSWM